MRTLAGVLGATTILAVGLLVVPPSLSRSALADAVVGTGTPASCTEAALDAALAAAGTVTFDCGATPFTITITTTKAIGVGVDATVDGGSLITLSGGGTTQVFTNSLGILTLANLTLSNGGAAFGGAIFNGPAATLNVTNSTFSNNSGGGGELFGSGAIYNLGTLDITNSTFSGNNATSGGGAILSSGTLNVSNSTFSGNSATGQGSGGAIYSIGALDITNSTFSGNSAPLGGSISTGSPATLRNTIVANSSADRNCLGPIIDSGNNLDSGATCLFFATGSLSNTDPILDPAGLANNGGPTETIALRAGSPAINAGNETVCAAPPVNNLDQRSFTRPGAGSVNCSIGAFEFSLSAAPTLPPPSPTPSNSPTPTRTATATLTYSPSPTSTDTATFTSGAAPTSTLPPPTFNATSTSPMATPSQTATSTPTPDAVPTLAAALTTCIGDCNGDGRVTVDELLRMVDVALGNAVVDTCGAGDANRDNEITIDEILTAVSNALNGCTTLVLSAAMAPIPGSIPASLMAVSPEAENPLRGNTTNASFTVRSGQVQMVGVLDTTKNFGWTALWPVWFQDQNGELGPLSTAVQMVCTIPGVFTGSVSRLNQTVAVVSELPEVQNLAAVLQDSASVSNPLGVPAVQSAYRAAVKAAYNAVAALPVVVDAEKRDAIVPRTRALDTAANSCPFSVCELDSTSASFAGVAGSTVVNLGWATTQPVDQGLWWLASAYLINTGAYSSESELLSASVPDYGGNAWAVLPLGTVDPVSGGVESATPPVPPVVRGYLEPGVPIWGKNDAVTSLVEAVIARWLGAQQPDAVVLPSAPANAAYEIHLYTFGFGLNPRYPTHYYKDSNLLGSWDHPAGAPLSVAQEELANSIGINVLALALTAVNAGADAESLAGGEKIKDILAVFPVSDYEKVAADLINPDTTAETKDEDFLAAALDTTTGIVCLSPGSFLQYLQCKELELIGDVQSFIDFTESAGNIGNALISVVTIEPWQGALAIVGDPWPTPTATPTFTPTTPAPTTPPPPSSPTPTPTPTPTTPTPVSPGPSPTAGEYCPIDALAVDPVTPRTLYAKTIGGVFKSTDAGDTWTAASCGLSSINDSPAFAIDPVTPTTLFTRDDGVFKSTDAGGSWKAANSGLTDTGVDALAISPVTPSMLYAGTFGGGVFESTDGGLSWSPINSGLPGWLVVAGGSTRYFVDALVIDPTTPSILYAGMDGNLVIPETVGAGVYKSTDAGGTWSPANSGIPRGVFTALTINPATPSTLYAGLEYADLSGASVYKSTDGGGSWAAANSGLTNTDVPVFAINRVTPSVLYAGTCGGGVFESTDAGGTWSATGLTGGCIMALAIDPVNPSTLYAGTGSGDAFKSTDAGGSWNAMKLGLECTPTYVTEFPLPDSSSQPTSITAGPPTDSNLWFTEMDFSSLTSKIGRITPKGTITEFPLASFVDFVPSASSQEITRGPDGNIWFTEYNSGKIGQILVNSPNTISEFTVPYPSSHPNSITAGPDGNLWFTDYGSGQVGQINPDDGTIEEFPLPGSTGNPFPSIMDVQLSGITAGPPGDGNLWSTGSFFKVPSLTYVTAIFRVTPAGTFTTVPVPSLSRPSGITAGPDGNLWFIGSPTTIDQVVHGSNGIGRILAASPNTITEFPVSGVGERSAITAGPDGNVWFTKTNGRIGRITPDGVIAEFPVGIVSASTGITAGSDGNLWLTNSVPGGQILRVNLSMLPPSAGQVCVTP